jgi:hypothetical protein
MVGTPAQADARNTACMCILVRVIVRATAVSLMGAVIHGCLGWRALVVQVLSSSTCIRQTATATLHQNTLGCSLIQKKHVHHLADYRIDRAGVFAPLLGFSSCIHTFRPTCFWARCPSCGAAPHGARWGSLEKATA